MHVHSEIGIPLNMSFDLGNAYSTKGQKYNRAQMSWPGRPAQDVWDRTQSPGQDVPS